MIREGFFMCAQHENRICHTFYNMMLNHAFFLAVSYWGSDYLAAPIDKITKIIHSAHVSVLHKNNCSKII